MKIGEIFRYSSKHRSPEIPFVDGLPNYYCATHTKGEKFPLLEAGINPIANVGAIDGERCPAILISSSPHKIGSAETPWQDFFDPDNGHIRYFGDNKQHGKDPTLRSGNKALLRQLEIHNSNDADVRRLAVPIIFFRRVPMEGRSKGNVQFEGFGICSRAERITQYNRKHNVYFSNYVFDFTVLSIASEDEELDWSWISSRRDSSLSLNETLKPAPNSWKQWIKEGPKSVQSVRRRVSKLLVYSSKEQKLPDASKELDALLEIYNFYTSQPGKKHRFEVLASAVAAEVIRESVGDYSEGWITPAGSDGGADFIGRITIGNGFGKAKLIVLGQAKCEKPDTPTGGNHIARTVARLKRG